MTAKAIKGNRFEDQYKGSNVPVMVLAAVAFFGLAFLLTYICIVPPVDGTGMGAIKNVMNGLGGSVAVFLPMVLAWIGVLCVGRARGMRVSALRVAADALLIVCLFTAVHIFAVEGIKSRYAVMLGYMDFISKSYRCAIGGGAIGALLSWPLYANLGVAGGFIATLLIAALLLTATGRMGRFVRFVNEKAGQRREKAPRRERVVEVQEQRRPARPAARRTPGRDPYSESVIVGDSGLKRRSATSRRKADPKADDMSRPARAVDQPTRRRRSADAIETQAGARRAPTAKAAPAAAKPTPVKRKKLYNEDIEKKNKAALAKADASVEKDELFDDFDDFDRLEAESAAFDEAVKAEKADKPEKARAARKAFKPDRPSMMQDKIEDVPAEDIPVEEIPVVKADRKSNVSIDDLKIEPEAYETPDDDEPPFDMAETGGEVKAGIAEKKSFGKLKRASKPEPAEDDVPPYNYPPIDLLARGEVEDTSVHNNRDMQKAHLLEDTLQSFGISAKLTGIAHGPAVTRFELQPAPGVKVSRITSLSDDIALNLAAMSVRIEAPIPGKAAVGVEIPNDKVEMVRLRDVLESSEARKHPSKIAVGLGKDNSGRYIVADIAKMPHVLIAGQTGSGKSVCINAIITSILFRSSPEEVKLILIDPKVVELSIYNNIPHLVCPVVTDPKKAASALDWAVAEMTKRYKLFAERGVRDIKGYNKSLQPGEKLMPQMVIIIDELADLMMVSPGEVEDSICRLAQLARACGMHLVIATQRPSVNVITGIIKANIPTRIAFSVASQVDSRTMIDHGGAEKLLGNGDMLFVPNGMKSMRVQGAWVSDEEVHAIVEYIKQSGEANYDPDMLEHMENAVRTDAEKEEVASEYDPRLPEAIDIVIDMGQASISMLQRRMRIGYAKAGRLIDEMAQRGIVSEADGAKPRQVLITREEAQAMFDDCA